MIKWPCVLKLEGDDELIYLNSATELNSECTDLIWSEKDRVIDSEGCVYSIATYDAGLKLESHDIKISAHEASLLIQSHEFSRAQLCLTKIQFEAVSDAIDALKSSGE
jgi:hypothetical protein